MKVIILAGGIGTRLKPLTDSIPKPLLKVGNKPILEWIISHLKRYGLNDIILTVGYKASVIAKYFGNGGKLGVKIKYAFEKERLGTAGPVRFAADKAGIKEAVLVMNGDILTKLDFNKMANFHKRKKAGITVGTIHKGFKIKYGAVNLKGRRITGVVEKPVVEFDISSGIYIIEPNIIEMVPKNRFFDMPTLIEKAIKAKKNVLAYPIKEEWVAIDRLRDYNEVGLNINKYIN